MKDFLFPLGVLGFIVLLALSFGLIWFFVSNSLSIVQEKRVIGPLRACPSPQLSAREVEIIRYCLSLGMNPSIREVSPSGYLIVICEERPK